MTIQVAVHHKTQYTYDRLVGLSPQVIRLRPAPHCRTPIQSYSLNVEPDEHFLNWQQDPQGNYLARLVFPNTTRRFSIEVDLIAEMTVINPFDFFLEPQGDTYPFDYDSILNKELLPYLETEPAGPRLTQLLLSIDRSPRKTVEFLVDLNQRLHQQIRYLIRMEPGVQSCEETLERASGSCRDSGWLLVQILRHLGLAARFVSGYLIQLVADMKPLDGPEGPPADFTDLHAWAEVYLPGAGWIGLDPTSGLLAGEGHIPLACTPDPASAAPITGSVEVCKTEFSYAMSLQRIHEDPRVTKPYTDEQWATILWVGHLVDQHLQAGDVRLTMGGEPTFVSIDDMQSEQWRTAALGEQKRRLADQLIRRLMQRFGPGGLLHYGQGKWYPGESLPRWAFSGYWRVDGEPIWRDQQLLARLDTDQGCSIDEAQEFAETLSERLGVDPARVLPAYEDVAYYLWREHRLPVNMDPSDPKLEDPEERARLARVFDRGLNEPVGCVLPLEYQWWQAGPRWRSGTWPIRSDRLMLIPGDSPVGFRLPLEALPYAPATGYAVSQFPLDPLEPRSPLPQYTELRQPLPTSVAWGVSEAPAVQQFQMQLRQGTGPRGRRSRERSRPAAAAGSPPGDVVRTALCVEPRGGRLHVFFPPLDRSEAYLELVAAIEDTAAELATPVVIEGYSPPFDPRLNHIKVTPDPGVIEVNIHPSASWEELVENTTTLYEEARLSRLGTEKFDLDGRHAGTGGGNHVLLGGPTPADSPFLRRPHVLRSLIAYWQSHPSLSYLFSGMFLGPTSQAPRVDEGRGDALYELEIAFQQIPEDGTCPPWLVDRVFRHLLVDVSGNTHRAEFCIDKLYSPDSPTGRLGLVEFRAFEMPPHARMSLTQQLLLRALVARFWEQPYRGPLVPWGTALHDRFMLPHFLWADFCDVIQETRRAGFPVESAWYLPHLEFRFPKIGAITHRDIHLELRSALEPWYVLGEEGAIGGTVRYVDSSVERMQVRATGITDGRFVIACNGRRVPLHPTGTVGEYVAGVRYRAWQPPSCLHPRIGVHEPLVFDIVDTWNQRSLGGCTYHVDHPGGLNPDVFPVNAFEAESRRVARFFQTGHTPGRMEVPAAETNPDFPLTLDLRRRAT